MNNPFVMTALAVVGLCLSTPTTPDTYPKNPGIDALNYAFTIELSDTTDAIVGEMAMDVRFVGAGVRAVRLDLIAANAATGGTGMRVSGVTLDGTAVPYTHADDALVVPLASAPAMNTRARLVVRYRGMPATGLKIGKNKHGDRTFFSDNWPDKARHWRV